MKKILSLILILLLLSLNVSCSKDVPPAEEPIPPYHEEITLPNEEVPDVPPSEDKETLSDDSQQVIAVPEFFSALTGLPCNEEELSVRPVAVMINCDLKSLPQSGTADADIVYECELEGGTVRMLAVYSEVSGDIEIGSTRSARPYFIDMAQIHGAVYVHSGGSPEAYVHIKDRKIDNLDGVNMYLSESIFYRNAEKRKSRGYEHSLMTTGNMINRGIELRSYNMTLDEDFSSGYFFKSSAESFSDNTASYIKIPYSSYVWSELTYSAQTELYSKSIYGEPQIDESRGETLSFANILVLFAPHRVLDSEGRLEVELTGEGEGYYFSLGEYMPIKWSRNSRDGSISYTDEFGETLLLNPGKTFVSVARKEMKSKLVIE